MADPKEFAVKTREQIRTDYTRTIKAGLQDIGIENPNVSKGTLDYLRGDALGAFGEDIGNLVQIKANAQMPDTAGKNDPDELRRLAKIIGYDLRPAGPSIGGLIIQTSVGVPVAVPTGAQVVDDAGLTYETTQPGPFSNGAIVALSSVDTGTATNLEAGTPVRWVSPPPFVVQNATIAQGGMVGGIDQETIEELRQRVLDYYRFPPGGGNWSQVAKTAEDSTTFVQRGFVYPAIYGGNTMHVAVIGRPTATNKSRVVSQTIVDTIVAPAVISAFPTFADIAVTTVNDYELNVSMALSLPTSKLASPPGPGGGWIDGIPWPKPAPATNFAFVVSVNNAADFVVRASGTPTVGARIVYVSQVNAKIYRASILSVSQPDAIGFPNDWRITTDIGIYQNNVAGTPIAANDWVFPDAQNMELYIAALYQAFADLGPAEKTNSSGLLPRALRKPPSTYTAPSQLGDFALRRVILSSDEVLDASYLLAPATVPIANGYLVPPYIGKPGKIAFYQSE